MTEERIVQNLLHIVSQITKKYDDIAKITGERYNIFQVLKVQRDELSHSAFIADLLNSNGKHGFEDKFLILFLENIKAKFTDSPIFDKLEIFTTAKSQVKIEQNISNKIEQEESGRMDILIVDEKHNHIIIENKVDALDQQLQLVRYHNSHKGAPILYLTKEGGPPSNISKQGKLNGVEYDLKEDIDFIRISYKEDIITWLEACLKETSNFPLLRETIKQYINVIKILTNQSTNKNMEKDIVDLITNDKDGSNVIAAFQIGNYFEKLKYKLMEDFANQLKLKAESSNFIGLELSFPDKIGKQGLCFRFRLKSQNNIFIDLQFIEKNFGKARINIVSENRDKGFLRLLNEKYRVEFKNINIGKIDGNLEALYPYGVFWSSQFDSVTSFFSLSEGWSKIPGGNLQIINDIVNVVHEIFKKIIADETLDKDIKEIEYSPKIA